VSACLSQAPIRGRLAICLATVAAAVCVGCGGGDVMAPPQPAHVVVEPTDVILESVGATQQFNAKVEDERGNDIPGAGVAWRSDDVSVASIDSLTGVARAQGAGITTITATAGAVRGEAKLEVRLAPVTDYHPGEVYFGRNDYVEYIAGELPIVLSVPHGGYARPQEIPDRTWGVTAQDRLTQELARAISEAVRERTGGYVHTVICHLHRSKLDANREIIEAAQGNSYARQAWYEFHHFIDAARRSVSRGYGRGLFIDLHGHGHDIQRLELGYLLSSSDLALSDEQLGQPQYIEKSSIRALALEADAGFVALVRGAASVGGLLAERGFPAVPSPAYPNPGGYPYYSGGYNTRRHGSRDSGAVSGVQVETHWNGLRDSAVNREGFATALAEALVLYVAQHFGIDMSAPAAVAHRSLESGPVLADGE
jgi:N-formylglutamate amidohydrolase